jgi:hypothetical protein
VLKAVALLRAEIDEVDKGGQDDLRDAIKGLEKFAGKLERNEVKSADEFKDAYTDAYQELSWYHYQRAEKMYGERHPGRIGRIMHRDRTTTGAETRAERREAWRERNRDRDVETTETWTKKLRHNVSESMENFGAWSKEKGQTVKEEATGPRGTLKRWTGKAIAGTGTVTEDIGEALNKWGEELRGYGYGVQRRAGVESTTETTRTENRY